MFLFLSGRRDGAFRVIPVTSDSGLLVSRPLRLALSRIGTGGVDPTSSSSSRGVATTRVARVATLARQ